MLLNVYMLKNIVHQIAPFKTTFSKSSNFWGGNIPLLDTPRVAQAGAHPHTSLVKVTPSPGSVVSFDVYFGGKIKAWKTLEFCWIKLAPKNKCSRQLWDIFFFKQPNPSRLGEIFRTVRAWRSATSYRFLPLIFFFFFFFFFSCSSPKRLGSWSSTEAFQEWINQW